MLGEQILAIKLSKLIKLLFLLKLPHSWIMLGKFNPSRLIFEWIDIQGIIRIMADFFIQCMCSGEYNDDRMLELVLDIFYSILYAFSLYMAYFMPYFMLSLNYFAISLYFIIDFGFKQCNYMAKRPSYIICYMSYSNKNIYPNSDRHHPKQPPTPFILLLLLFLILFSFLIIFPVIPSYIHLILYLFHHLLYLPSLHHWFICFHARFAYIFNSLLWPVWEYRCLSNILDAFYMDTIIYAITAYFIIDLS